MKPGWSKPHTHSNLTNLALFRHKITLYRFNQGAQMGAGGLRPPSPLTLTTVRSTHYLLTAPVCKRSTSKPLDNVTDRLS